MNTITVKKLDLLIKLRENKEAHVEKYKEALRGYRVKAAEELTKKLEKVRSGKKFDLYSKLNEPNSHEKEYTTVIEMLEFDIKDQVEVTEQEFKAWVKDDWTWKSSFTSSNSGYIGIGTSTSENDMSAFSGITFSDNEM